MQNLLLRTGPPPHVKSPETVPIHMIRVIVALVPVFLVSVFFFKMAAVALMAICVATTCLTEVVVRRLMHRKPQLHDGSAVVTGVLLALCLPATFPWWLAVIGGVLAIALAKELMGGLGWNLFNPALFGRVALIVMAPAFVRLNADLAHLRLRMWGLDAISTATPMALVKLGQEVPGHLSLFLGYPGGSLAETSGLAVLAGGLFLIYLRVIDWRIPVSILSTVFVLTAVLGADPLFHLVAGGLLLGAFFMATDWVTSPVTKLGRIIFGVAIGVLVVVFRLYQATPEGVAFSILIMNAFVPVIERLTVHAKFGEVVPVKASFARGLFRR